MSSMTDNTTYNGWKNYPTWCVSLWIDSDEGNQLYALALARDAAESETPRVDLADALRDWLTDDAALPALMGDASMWADLLGYAIDCVDWFEIADAFLAARAELD